jgi:hypothetical protein
MPCNAQRNLKLKLNELLNVRLELVKFTQLLRKKRVKAFEGFLVKLEGKG